MINKQYVTFSLDFKADGTHDKLVVNLASAPVSITVPSGTALMSGGVPTGVEQVACAGTTISSSTIALGTMTIDFGANVAAGDHSLTGRFTYA